VTRAACDAASRSHLTLRVPLGAATLHDPALVARVEEVLEATGLAPERLVVGCAEHLVMAQPERGRAVLERLAALGVGVALTDFGRGPSSIAHLTELPVGTVWIDHRLVAPAVADGPRHDGAASLVRAIVRVAAATGVRAGVDRPTSPLPRDALLALGLGLAVEPVDGTMP
jgi:EAL domain-containing protein (putative c-di-GMP-specific phosphodiesterase class I)